MHHSICHRTCTASNTAGVPSVQVKTCQGVYRLARCAQLCARAHLDRDVFLALRDHDADRRHVRVNVLVLEPVRHRPQAVLHELEHDVVEVGGDVGEREAAGAVDAHLGRIPVLAQADVACVAAHARRAA